MNPSVKTKREKADSSDTRETGDTVEHERSRGAPLGQLGRGPSERCPLGIFIVLALFLLGFRVEPLSVWLAGFN